MDNFHRRDSHPLDRRLASLHNSCRFIARKILIQAHKANRLKFFGNHRPTIAMFLRHLRQHITARRFRAEPRMRISV